MRAKLVSIMSSDVCDLESFSPDDNDGFALGISFFVTSDDDAPGQDMFQIRVVTPSWLGQNYCEPISGRHMLIVSGYNYQAIVEWIEKCVSSVEGPDWTAVATKLARMAYWEFEDCE